MVSNKREARADRRYAMTRTLFTALLGAAAFSAVLLSGPIAANAEGAPFCIAQSGPNGENSYVGNCNFASYDGVIPRPKGRSSAGIRP